jgi:hypothetical protein
MKVIFTIAVRNSDWYWTKEEMENAGNYRKEWEALNEDKIWKYVPSDTFEVPFDVKDVKENREAEFDFKFTLEDKSKSASCHIKDLTIVQFAGENEEEKIEVIISNSLIHQYIGARQKEYKYYVYFYIKENLYYERFHQLIWLSEEHKLEIEQKLSQFSTPEL